MRGEKLEKGRKVNLNSLHGARLKTFMIKTDDTEGSEEHDFTCGKQ